MPVWIRHIVLKWMAQLLGFKVPRQKRQDIANTQEQDHTTVLHRNKTNAYSVNNKPKLENAFRQGASSLDTLAAPRNGIQSLVKQLSHSNLRSGNYKSGPALRNPGSVPRLTVTQEEDWCIASSNVSLCSNDDHDQRHNMSETGADGEDGRRMEELLKMQEKMLEHIQTLTNEVAKNEHLQQKKDEWNMVASIFDRAFRILFLIMFFLSALTIVYLSLG